MISGENYCMTRSFEAIKVNERGSSGMELLYHEPTGTSVRLTRLACAAHAGAIPLSLYRNLPGWFRVERR